MLKHQPTLGVISQPSWMSCDSDGTYHHPCSQGICMWQWICRTLVCLLHTSGIAEFGPESCRQRTSRLVRSCCLFLLGCWLLAFALVCQKCRNCIIALVISTVSAAMQYRLKLLLPPFSFLSSFSTLSSSLHPSYCPCNPHHPHRLHCPHLLYLPHPSSHAQFLLFATFLHSWA